MTVETCGQDFSKLIFDEPTISIKSFCLEIQATLITWPHNTNYLESLQLAWYTKSKIKLETSGFWGSITQHELYSLYAGVYK